jgi:hypothetical protein
MNEPQEEEVTAMESILPEAFTFDRDKQSGGLVIKPGYQLKKLERYEEKKRKGFRIT